MSNRCYAPAWRYKSDPGFLDLAIVGKNVVEFYKKRGGRVVSPLEKAIHL